MLAEFELVLEFGPGGESGVAGDGELGIGELGLVANARTGDGVSFAGSFQEFLCALAQVFEVVRADGRGFR